MPLPFVKKMFELIVGSYVILLKPSFLFLGLRIKDPNFTVELIDFGNGGVRVDGQAGLFVLRVNVQNIFDCSVVMVKLLGDLIY